MCGGRCCSQGRHPLKVACDANRADKLAKIDRQELATRDGHHRKILESRWCVDTRIGRDELIGERRVGVGPEPAAPWANLRESGPGTPQHVTCMRAAFIFCSDLFGYAGDDRLSIGVAVALRAGHLGQAQRRVVPSAIGADH